MKYKLTVEFYTNEKSYHNYNFNYLKNDISIIILLITLKIISA